MKPRPPIRLPQSCSRQPPQSQPPGADGQASTAEGQSSVTQPIPAEGMHPKSWVTHPAYWLAHSIRAEGQLSIVEGQRTLNDWQTTKRDTPQSSQIRVLGHPLLGCVGQICNTEGGQRTLSDWQTVNRDGSQAMIWLSHWIKAEGHASICERHQVKRVKRGCSWGKAASVNCGCVAARRAYICSTRPCKNFALRGSGLMSGS